MKFVHIRRAKTGPHGRTEMVWWLGDEEMTLLGHDAADLNDWANTTTVTVAALRSHLLAHQPHPPAPASAETWSFALSQMQRLDTRLAGIREAATRRLLAFPDGAHRVAAALDLDHVDAEALARRYADTPPSFWARWATGELDHPRSVSGDAPETA